MRCSHQYLHTIRDMSASQVQRGTGGEMVFTTRCAHTAQEFWQQAVGLMGYAHREEEHQWLLASMCPRRQKNKFI